MSLLDHHRGTMASLMKRVDWDAASIGRPETWPQALKTIVDLMLASRQPMFIAWGPEQIWFYNDAFIPILGKKHPHALGVPAMEVWAEARDVLEPMFTRVFNGQSVQMEDFALLLDRRGKLEEAHFSFSYTPVRDDKGTVCGLFGACIETTTKVLAERQALAERERLAKLFEQAPTFMAFLTGGEHRIEFANPGYLQLVGNREILGRTVAEALPDAADQGYVEILDNVLATGVPYRADAALFVSQPEPNGPTAERYVDFVFQPIVGADGRPEGIFVQGADVTERAIAEGQVREQVEWRRAVDELSVQFNDLVDPAEIAYAAAEMLGKTLNVSRAGYGNIDPANETIVIRRDWNAPGIQSLAGLLHFRDYGSYIEDLKRGETVVLEDAELDPRTRETAEALKAISAQSLVNMPVTEQDGLVALLYLNHNMPRKWRSEELAFIREVAERTRMAAERRRAENELIALTATLEARVEERTAERDRVWRNSRDLLTVVGSDGIFRRVNPAWETVLGYSSAQIEGRSFLEFIWPEDAAKTQSALDQAARSEDLTAFENRYQHVDGTPRWISWYTAAEGDFVYAYGRDITWQKEQAAALEQAQEALRQSQKLEAMGQLTGGVAHDFNNLLTPIMGSLDMLQRREVGGEREQRLIDGALQSAERAKTLVQRLLAFSRRQPLKSVAVDVGALVQGISELVGSTTGPQIRVAVEVAGDLPSAVADPNQLEMAILNLSVNARDAMPNGGTLRIAAEKVLVKGRKDPDLAPGEYIIISVADTGVGMDEDTLAHAIEPFFSTKGVGKGTGLGLSMVHGLAAQLGGGLRISSHVGVGTNVELWLPVTNEAPSTAESKEGSTDPREGGLVLLVDDESVARSTTADMLSDLGFAVTEATSGEEALSMLRRGHVPDLMISDHLMPGISGEELVREAQVILPEMRVLIVSGFAGLDEISPDIPRLNKPFRQVELANTIAKLVSDDRA
jgi:PAS domain S-box-containing protein